MRKCSPGDETLGAGRPEATPLPHVAAAAADPRLVDVWCAFLGQLGTNAEAAMAAAMAYRELQPELRDVWIAAIEQDMDRVTVPRIALYAPLLAVETDPRRRTRILAAIGPVQADAKPKGPAFALRGRDTGPSRIAAIVAPLYLDFVQVMACAYRPGEAFDWVKHDPIVESARAPRAGEILAGTVLEAIPLKAAVDDLAITVVAHTRTGRALPEALSVFADLFGPTPAEAPAAAVF